MVAVSAILVELALVALSVIILVSGEWVFQVDWVKLLINLLAELQAIKHGLQLSWQFQMRQVVCESDSLEAIDLIKKADLKFHSYASIISHIRLLLNQDCQVNLVHII